jgi:hypothetical protein
MLVMAEEKNKTEGGSEGGSPRNIPQKPNEPNQSKVDGSFRNAGKEDARGEMGEEYAVKQEEAMAEEEARTEKENDH